MNDSGRVEKIKGGERKGKHRAERGPSRWYLTTAECHSLALVRRRSEERLSQLCSLDDMLFYAMIIDLIDDILGPPASNEDCPK